jgi:hypothetical protein
VIPTTSKAMATEVHKDTKTTSHESPRYVGANARSVHVGTGKMGWDAVRASGGYTSSRFVAVNCMNCQSFATRPSARRMHQP